MKSRKDNSILRLLLILGDGSPSGVLYTKELEFDKKAWAKLLTLEAKPYRELLTPNYLNLNEFFNNSV